VTSPSGFDPGEAAGVADRFGVALEQLRRDHLMSLALEALTTLADQRRAFPGQGRGETISGSARRRSLMDVAKLAELQLFDGLSRQQLEMIAQYAVEVDVPEGKALVRDAALAWDFYVIEEGSAEVRRGETKLGTLGAGDFFGEIGVLASDQRRTASVVATSPMKAIRLTTHQLRTITQELPEVAERLRAAVAEREQRLL
jgi:CRP/FNR family cyclic AMP-dependent transcriptional regulator